jgi:hypothetical protein
MAFETFKRQRAPISVDPAVTIQKRGTLSLNGAAYRALNEPEAVELLYDRDQKLMGLRKAEPSTGHAYVVRPLGKGGSNWLISGKAFTTYYDIPIGVARRWAGHVENDLLIVDLKEPGLEVTSNRNPERSLFAS